MIRDKELLETILRSFELGSELRRGPHGKEVIIPYIRVEKPEQSEQTLDDICVFCPEHWPDLSRVRYYKGKQSATEEEKGVCTIFNKFPLVVQSSKEENLRQYPSTGILSDSMIATGKHLVVIESREHNIDPFSASSK